MDYVTVKHYRKSHMKSKCVILFDFESTNSRSIIFKTSISQKAVWPQHAVHFINPPMLCMADFLLSLCMSVCVPVCKISTNIEPIN